MHDVNVMNAWREIAFDQCDVISSSVSLHKPFFLGNTVDQNLNFAPDPSVISSERNLF